MKLLVLLLILLKCHIIQGVLEWTVVGKVTDYGQNVTLFCNVSNCCPKDAGWDRWTPIQRTLFIDIKTGRTSKKYDGKVLKDGYTLVIKNLTKQDLNVSYSCLYGVTLGERKFLLEEDVFMLKSTTQPTESTIKSIFSDEEIAGLILGVSIAVAIVIFIICFSKQWKRRHGNNTTSIKGEDESVPLIDNFLEYPSDVECIEGEDAVFTCKVLPNSPSVIWLNKGNNITQKETIVNEQHILTVKNTTASDSGEYCVQAGMFSKNVRLDIYKDYFLEYPSDVECNEGEDAVFTCKIRKSSPSVIWLNKGNPITKDNCSETILDTQHTLTVKNTTASDSGEYCVKVGKFSKKVLLNIYTEIPRAISTKEQKAAIQFGKEVRKYVRIHVIGKDRVGKTSLVRRLLFLEKGFYSGESTVGIEIDRTCLQIRESDGEWIVGEEKITRQETIRRILQAVHTKQKGKEPVSVTSYPLPSKENTLEKDKKIKSKKQMASTEITDEPLDVVPKINDDTKITNSIPLSSSHTSDISKSFIADDNEKSKLNDIVDSEQAPDLCVLSAVESEKSDYVTKLIIEKLDNILLDAEKEKKIMQSRGLVECGIWDFAGQKDYYATHQTFFTEHAIYILVADIMDDIKPKQDEFDTIGDYIEFWFDSIHCYCKDTSKSKLCPAVIMVCTGTDKVGKVEDEERKYRENFLNNFGTQQKIDHKRGLFFISNKDFCKKDLKEIERLRDHISQIAKEMNYFSEEVPTKWIQLENVLDVLRDLKMNVYSLENMKKLANRNLKEELIPFLKYQHQIGNIIFIIEIKEYIILEPDWLVQCFRCLVFDYNHADNTDRISLRDMNELKKSGKLSDRLIDQLFDKDPNLKFRENKSHLLNVMEYFDIIVKPEFWNTKNDECLKADSYYLPCMIDKYSTYEHIKNQFMPINSITPWLVFEFEFLPFACFNHILFHYIRNYKVCKVNTEHPAIFRGKAVFCLDGFRKLIICFSHNAISLQIWEWKEVKDDLYKNVLNNLFENIVYLRRKLRQNILFRIKAKCSSGEYSNFAGRISVKDLKRSQKLEDEIDEYLCGEHNVTHKKREIESTWLNHVHVLEKSILMSYAMVPNPSGGFSYDVDDFISFQRYLYFGVQGGSFYETQREMEKSVIHCINRLLDRGRGQDVLNLIKVVNTGNLAWNQSPMIQTLAICSQRSDDPKTKALAYRIFPDVCRIPTHVFEFIKLCERDSSGTGWGRAKRRAISNWYNGFEKKPMKLAHLITKYKARHGWNHRDIVKLAHIKPRNSQIALILRYITHGLKHTKIIDKGDEDILDFLKAVETASKGINVNIEQVRSLMVEFSLDREHIHPNFLGNSLLWGTLMRLMPVTAILRNLNKLSSLGFLQVDSFGEKLVEDRISIVIPYAKGMHPLNFLVAWYQYKTRYGHKGKLSWPVNNNILNTLENAFYLLFDHIPPTRKRLCLAVDVSESMKHPICGSILGARDVAVALVLLIAKIELDYQIVAFSHQCTEVDITKNDNLLSAIKKLETLPTGKSNCALPIEWARENRKRFDAFIIFTDSETSRCHNHPVEAFNDYRQNEDVRLINIVMVGNTFSIINPNDPFMIDIVGVNRSALHQIKDFLLSESPCINSEKSK